MGECTGCVTREARLNESIGMTHKASQQVAAVGEELTAKTKIVEQYRSALEREKQERAFCEQQQTTDKAREVAADILLGGMMTTAVVAGYIAFASPQLTASIVVIGTVTTVATAGIAYTCIKVQKAWNSFWKIKGD